MSLNLASYLAAGYSTEQIFEFLQKTFPSIAKAARNFQKTGKSAEEIIRILSNLSPSQLKETDKRASKLNYDTPLERSNAGERDQSNNPILQGAKEVGNLLGPAAGIYGIARGLPALAKTDIGKNLLGHLGLSEQQKQPSQFDSTIAPSTHEGFDQKSQPGVSLPMANLPEILPQNTPRLESPTPGITPQTIPQERVSSQQPPIDSKAILGEMQLEPKINNLLKAGNPSDVVAGVIDKTLTPGQKKWLDSQIKEGKAKPLTEMIADYAQNPSTDVSQKEVSQEVQPLDISKGSIVATPEGTVGELETSRNGEALVKDNHGKLHKVKVDDLIESPLPKKDLAELHEELIKGIEEETGEDVSRNVNWAGYDPEFNELLYLPHDGSAYVYEKISPEDVELLTNILTTRKTSGSNFIGAWKQGSKSPIGAQMSAFIRKLQAERGGKGNEYSRKYATVYSALEPAVKAAKEAKRKKKKPL